MDKIIDIINKHLPPRISIPLILHIVVLTGLLYISPQKGWESFSKKACELLPMLTISTTATILYLILVASYILLCLNIRKTLKPRFGILWDKDKEPYCPIHEKPLSRHKLKKNGKTVTGLECRKCTTSFHAIDNGEILTLEEAQKKL